MSEKEALDSIEKWYAAKLLRVYTPDVEKNLVRSAVVDIAEHFDAFQAFSTAYKVSFGLDELTDLYKPNGLLPVLRSDFFSKMYQQPLDLKLDLFVTRSKHFSDDIDCAFVQSYRSPTEFAGWVISTSVNEHFFDDISLISSGLSDDELQKSKDVVMKVLIEEPTYEVARFLFDDIAGRVRFFK